MQLKTTAEGMTISNIFVSCRVSTFSRKVLGGTCYYTFLLTKIAKVFLWIRSLPMNHISLVCCVKYSFTWHWTVLTPELCNCAPGNWFAKPSTENISKNSTFHWGQSKALQQLLSLNRSNFPQKCRRALQKCNHILTTIFFLITQRS